MVGQVKHLFEEAGEDFLEDGQPYPSSADRKWPGTFKFPDLVDEDVTLESEEEVLKAEEKAKFLVFTRRMLQWYPEDRPSAAELLDDPWFGGLGEEFSPSS